MMKIKKWLSATKLLIVNEICNPECLFNVIEGEINI